MLIHVKIHPEATKDEVMEKSDLSYIVHVREKAERNEANVKMRKILAEYLNIETGKVRIVTGHHSPSKIVEIVE